MDLHGVLEVGQDQFMQAYLEIIDREMVWYDIKYRINIRVPLETFP